jgi:HAD superfamily hydrolase (TIGR01484 family)
MKPLRELDPRDAANVRTVFTDIDDTLTTDGRLPHDSFRALWMLAAAGVAVVPVTGRPAGWCDHFARMWPIAGVVGENGAFYFRYTPATKKMVARYVLGPEERATLQTRLGHIRERVLAEVKGSAIASDQPYRIHDLAIDYCEDVVPPLSTADVAKIVRIFEQEGATAKVSSIHVNGWFGKYDKLGMMRTFAHDVLELDLNVQHDLMRALYAGDSPNDEPAFAFFPLSIGVANVRRFAATMKHPPAYVTRADGGAGFAELARHILRAKATTLG